MPMVGTSGHMLFFVVLVLNPYMQISLHSHRMGIKMRGGTKRFQAQYLKLIHVPAPSSIDGPTAARLKEAFENKNRGRVSEN